MNALTTTLYELFADNLDERADKTALVDSGRSITYKQLSYEIDRIAGFMADAGITPQDRVGVHLRKSIQEVIVMIAASKVGAVTVNINSQWNLDQLCYVADDCQLKFIATEERCARRLLRIKLPRSVTGILVNGKATQEVPFYSWDEALESSPQAPASLLDTELAMIIYTSGSTGAPKGVMLSHRNLVAGARSVARYLGLCEQDRLISVLPYSFDCGFNQLSTMLLVGGTVVHQTTPMATEIVRTLKEHEITGLAAVPPIWNQLVRLLAEHPVELQSLRFITNTGGKVPKNILQQMPLVFPNVDIYLMYGLTEAFRSTFLPPDKFEEKIGSIGQAIPGAEVYVVKEGEGLAKTGEHGELVHRGPLVSLGYWGKPEDTAEKIRTCPELKHLLGDELVVYSGDIVVADDDGDLWFQGRNDSMIKCSGFRLSPDEVEDLIAQSGVIGDAVAFGVDDEELGQVVHIAVTPLDQFDNAAVMAHCRKVMPPYMIPRAIHVWKGEMPRTSSGKIAKPQVVEMMRLRIDSR